MGLDDYLCKYTLEEFYKLPSIEIKNLSQRMDEAKQEELPELLKEISQIESETERSLYVQKLFEKFKFKIPKRAIQRDIKKFREKEDKAYKKETGYIANFPGLIDVVESEGVTSFLIIDRENEVLKIEREIKLNGVLYIPPEKDYLPFSLPRAEAVLKWYVSDNEEELFQDVLAYLKRFSYLQERQWLIVALKVFLTYLQDHPDIFYLPMILFYAVPERGKSRTGKAAIYISFRGIHVVDLREANLFRYSQDF